MIPATPRFHRSFTAQTNAWFLKDTGDRFLLPGFILYVGESGEGATAIPHFKNSKNPIDAVERIHSAVRTRSCSISMQAKCSVAVGIVTMHQRASSFTHDGLHPSLSL